MRLFEAKKVEESKPNKLVSKAKIFRNYSANNIKDLTLHVKLSIIFYKSIEYLPSLQTVRFQQGKSDNMNQFARIYDTVRQRVNGAVNIEAGFVYSNNFQSFKREKLKKQGYMLSLMASKVKHYFQCYVGQKTFKVYLKDFFTAADKLSRNHSKDKIPKILIGAHLKPSDFDKLSKEVQLYAFS